MSNRMGISFFTGMVSSSKAPSFSREMHLHNEKMSEAATSGIKQD